jgi:hypothetical protein
MVYKTKKRISRKPLSKKYGSKKRSSKNVKKTMKKRRSRGKKMTQRGGFPFRKSKEQKDRETLRDEIIALGFENLTKEQEQLKCKKLQFNKEEKKQCTDFLIILKYILERINDFKPPVFKNFSMGTDFGQTAPTPLESSEITILKKRIVFENFFNDTDKRNNIFNAADKVKALIEANLQPNNIKEYIPISTDTGYNKPIDFTTIIKNINEYTIKDTTIKKEKEKRKHECKNCKKCTYKFTGPQWWYKITQPGDMDYEDNWQPETEYTTADRSCKNKKELNNEIEVNFTKSDQNVESMDSIEITEDTKLCDECVEETRTSAIAAANELKAAADNTLFNLNNVSSASIANN